MSLSQKFPGLCIVPWFNKNEWIYVSHLIYSEYEGQQLEGLKLLKIWKLRSANLPVGIEGTLLLLEALIKDHSHLCEDEIVSIYSFALMRFLNFSVSTNGKQGLFDISTFKNEIPKWIVDLRHEIAHGYHPPSKQSLHKAILFGFDWLKTKYWLQQENAIENYNPQKTIYKPTCISTILKSYCSLAIKLYEGDKLDKVFFEEIKTLIKEALGKKAKNPYSCIDILENVIRSYFSSPFNEAVIKDCVDYLVSPTVLLRPNFETSFDNERSICKSFRNLWKTLLNILNDIGLLYFVIDGMFYATAHILYLADYKAMAGMWINELLISLINLKEKNSRAEDCIDYLSLDSNAHFYTDELQNLQKKMIRFPNVHLKLFVANLLKYNDSKTFTAAKFNYLVDIFTGNNPDRKVITKHNMTNKIYTVDDLENRPPLESEKDDWKVKLLEDTSEFVNCPLGVLPSQLNKPHPFLPINKQL